MPGKCLGTKEITGSLQGAADSSPGGADLLDENSSAALFWAGAVIGGEDVVWCVQTEWGLFPHVAVGLYLGACSSSSVFLLWAEKQYSRKVIF